jgi:GLPGLI family protein
LAPKHFNMKRTWIAGLAILIAGTTNAQMKEGKVTYERVTKVIARFNINGVENETPQMRKENYELNFTPTQTMWKAGESPDDDLQNNAGDGGNMNVHMIIGGGNDMLYTNLETGKKTEKRDFMDKSFIVDDSVRKLKWKMTGETKTILNHPCMQAIATNISQRTTMTMNNGSMEKKEVSDTALIVAWFASDIPVSAGPAEYQGQLPGLILAMDVSNGKQTFMATAISEKADVASIKEPVGKKHYTPVEFRKEMNKMMDEMQQNMGGGNRQVRFN